MLRSRFFRARYFNGFFFGIEGDEGTPPVSSGDDWIMRLRRRRGR